MAAKKSKKSSSSKKTKKSSKSTKEKSTNNKLPKNPSMGDLLEHYGQDVKVKGFEVGEVVKGQIVDIAPGRVAVDIGGKSEGVVAEKAYNEAQDYIQTLKVGQKVEAKVIVPEMPDGRTILSFRHTARNAAWEELEEAEKKDEELEVLVTDSNRAGLLVEYGNLTGFVPKSHLGPDIPEDFSSLVGKQIKVKVLSLDREENRIVFSEKAVSQAEEIALQDKALDKIKEGEMYEGVVTTIYDFGAFVRIHVKVDKEDVPLEGLVHISELSWAKVNSAKEEIEEGDEVKVRVIGKREGKLALSMKQTKDDPWENIEKNYEKDQKVKGSVVRTTDFGVFVELEPGVEGLIHMTKIPPGKSYDEGDDVNVYIEEIDKDSRKIGLGIVLTAKPVGYK